MIPAKVRDDPVVDGIDEEDQKSSKTSKSMKVAKEHKEQLQTLQEKVRALFFSSFHFFLSYVFSTYISEFDDNLLFDFFISNVVDLNLLLLANCLFHGE